MGSKHTERDGASPGKIFVGGLHKEATLGIAGFGRRATGISDHIEKVIWITYEFRNYFEKYGGITDSVIMRNRHTQQPRGFGFVTYADPSVVDKVIEDTHVIRGKQVEIKRTIPKGSVQANDFKTKKIFVGGVPATCTDDDFKNFFSKHGKVVEHQIIRDRATNRSRGFGFIVFDNEEEVDRLLINGNMIDMLGNQVEIKKAEPKKAGNPPPVPALGKDTSARPFGDSFGGFGDAYGGFGVGGFGAGPFRGPGGLGDGRFGGYGGYGNSGNEFSGGYGNFGGSSLDGYRGESSFGSYGSRFGSYGGGGFGGGSGLGGYGRGVEGYGNYGSGLGGSFESGPGSSYSGAGGVYGNRTGYSGGSRYHPYSK